MKHNTTKTVTLPTHLPEHPPKIRLKLDKINQVYYHKGDLRTKILTNLKTLLTNELDTLGITGDARLSVISELFTELTDPEIKVLLPDKAPELYKERTNRKEKPDAFIRRVYAKWLGRGLLRPHIKDLDSAAYRAMYKHGIPDDFETLLPTAQGRSINDLSRSDADLLEAKRTSRRNADRKRRRELAC